MFMTEIQSTFSFNLMPVVNFELLEFTFFFNYKKKNNNGTEHWTVILAEGQVSVRLACTHGRPSYQNKERGNSDYNIHAHTGRTHRNTKRERDLIL